MENDIKIFEFEKHEVETIFLDGEPLFNPYSVSKCLDLKESSLKQYLWDMDNAERFDMHQLSSEDLTNLKYTEDSGRYWLKEPGLYQLILKSRKPEAQKFTRWVTHELLPEIRKTGSYEIKGSQDRLINNLVANTEALLGVKREELAIFQAESWNKKLSNLMIDCARHGLGSMKELYDELYYVFSAETGIDIVEIATLKGMKTREYLKENQSVAKTVYEFAHQHFTRPDRQVILVPSQTTLDGMI